MTRAQATKIKKLLPLIDAIKKKCLDCSAGSIYEVKICNIGNCPLFDFRQGINDFRRENSSKTAQNKPEGADDD